MILIILLGISFTGMFYFLINFIATKRDLRNMNYVEIRNAEISEQVNKNSKIPFMDKFSNALNEVGYYGDLTPIFFVISFLYLTIAIIFKTLGVKDIISLFVALPLSTIIAYLTLLKYKTKQNMLFQRQLLQVLSLTVAALENSENPVNAFSKASLTVADPLRKEFQRALSSMVSAEDTLSVALKLVYDKYPSRSFELIMAALSIDDKVGAKLSQPLRQAQSTLEKDFELSSEADAEISQARSEFYSLSIVIAVIAILLVTGSQGAAQKAYASPIGIFSMIFLLTNYFFGVFRTLKIFNRAKRGY